MADIMTQNQIDELLSELTGEKLGETQKNLDKKHIKTYDFRSPKKMSRDQKKMLSSVTDVLARHLAAYFAGMLRSYCEIEIASVEEHPYYEYNNSLPDTLMTAVIDIESLNGAFLIDISNNLTFTLVERMLGGNIEEVIVPDREFTEIEITLAERIFKRICSFIQDALQYIPGSKVTLRQIETNSRFIKAIRIEEVVEVVIYNVMLGPVKGTITACIPYNYVETMLAGIAETNSKNEIVKNDEAVKMNMLSELSDALVDVCAVLGNVKLSLRDVMGLSPGDVIKLDQRVGNSALVTVNGNNWFWGEPGVKKNSKAVRLSKYYKDKP